MNARLEDVTRRTMQRLYYAEKRTAEALRMFAELADDESLGDALREHSQDAATRVKRLREGCGKRGWQTDGPGSSAVEGVRKEAQKALSGEEPGPVTDAVLALLARKLVRLQMADYGAAATFALELGDLPLAGLLTRSFADEREWDDRVADLVRSRSTRQAAPDDVTSTRA